MCLLLQELATFAILNHTEHWTGDNVQWTGVRLVRDIGGNLFYFLPILAVGGQYIKGYLLLILSNYIDYWREIVQRALFSGPFICLSIIRITLKKTGVGERRWERKIPAWKWDQPQSTREKPLPMQLGSNYECCWLVSL